MTNARMQARKLSHRQRELIIEHVDGPRRLIADADSSALTPLIRLGYLQWVLALSTRRPTHTALTEQGQVMLREILALAADLLSRAGIKTEVNALIEGTLQRAKDAPGPTPGRRRPRIRLSLIHQDKPPTDEQTSGLSSPAPGRRDRVLGD